MDMFRLRRAWVGLLVSELLCPICDERIRPTDPVQSFGMEVSHADCARLMRSAVPWAEKVSA